MANVHSVKPMYLLSDGHDPIPYHSDSFQNFIIVSHICSVPIHNKWRFRTIARQGRQKTDFKNINNKTMYHIFVVHFILVPHVPHCGTCVVHTRLIV